jgi:hypothetical protein
MYNRINRSIIDRQRFKVPFQMVIYIAILNFSRSFETISSFLLQSSWVSHLASRYLPDSHSLFSVVSHTEKAPARSTESISSEKVSLYCLSKICRYPYSPPSLYLLEPRPFQSSRLPVEWQKHTLLCLCEIHERALSVYYPQTLTSCT